MNPTPENTGDVQSGERLARRLTVPELVRVYRHACAEIQDAYRRIAAAENALNDAFTLDGFGSIQARSRGGVCISHDDASDALSYIRRDVWRVLIERLEVRRMMSVARSAELTQQIERGDLPEITEESVGDVIRGFNRNLTTMLEEAVEETFDWLRPRRSTYKTNTELEIGRKVILRYVVEQWGKLCSRWHVNYHRDPQLTALENVFSALDGKGQITKGHYSRISEIIRGSDRAAPPEVLIGETEYFRFKCFKNGNMHLEFRRLDLLKKFNAIAGGRRLRPAESAAS